MVSDKLLSYVANALYTEITHLGVGEGAAPNVDDSALESELVRKECTSYLDGYEVIKEIYLDETEQNDITLTNVGVYGEDNTFLFAGASIEIEKTEGESLTISYEILVERN